MHGLRDQVAALLRDRPEPLLCAVPLSKLLTARREALGITRMELAQLAGMAHSRLFDYENATPGFLLKNPPIRTLEKLANAYQLPFPLVMSAAMREAGLLNAPGAPTPNTRRRDR